MVRKYLDILNLTGLAHEWQTDGRIEPSLVIACSNIVRGALKPTMCP